MIKDDRGPLDLTKLIDDKDKVIKELTEDNKKLAKQVSNLEEEKKLRTLDKSL
jgi:hypothetical protein|tara:strand:+ start:575 stop:733 length:159 start_codon:yes stop_codon:yes gene_type:complete